MASKSFIYKNCFHITVFIISLNLPHKIVEDNKFKFSKKYNILYKTIKSLFLYIKIVSKFYNV